MAETDRNMPVPLPCTELELQPSTSNIRPDPKLLEQLVCPITRGPLEYDAANQELVSRSARLAYPIRDGIPIMLPDEARILPG
jgi:Uncharacterized conserved protein